MSEKRVFIVNFTSTRMEEIIVPRIDIPPDSKIVRIFKDPIVHSEHSDTVSIVFETEHDDPRYFYVPEGAQIPIVVPSFYETVEVKKWS